MIVHTALACQEGQELVEGVDRIAWELIVVVERLWDEEDSLA